MPVNSILEIENGRKVNQRIDLRAKKDCISSCNWRSQEQWISGKAWSRSHALSWGLGLSPSLSVLFLYGKASPLGRLFPHHDPAASSRFTPFQLSNSNRKRIFLTLPKQASGLSVPGPSWVTYPSLGPGYVPAPRAREKEDQRTPSKPHGQRTREGWILKGIPSCWAE